MNILIIGAGGREHAFAWKVAQSTQVERIWVAPGNAGTALENKVTNLDINDTDVDQLVAFAKDNHIALTIIGPEAPLAAGICDRFHEAGLLCCGPSQQAAQLETSKTFAKEFMQRHNIPTAQYATFTDKQSAFDYLTTQRYPVVIKADGLAAGKGVVIAKDEGEAYNAISEMLEEKRFGQAGERIIIEEFLQGQEMSYIVLSDGGYILTLASTQDHKRRDDDNKGPNTGGMGAISPSPLHTIDMDDQIMRKIIAPTIEGMSKEGTPYVGFLYAGLMITPEGEAKVLEFNCRMGDPETQPILMRLRSDLVGLCLAACEGRLGEVVAQWDPRRAVCVVMTAGGYPLQYHRGDLIQGLNECDQDDTLCKIFHAGTALKDNAVFTNGGRVLGITTLGETFQTARELAYNNVHTISWANCYYRNDIGSVE